MKRTLCFLPLVAAVAANGEEKRPNVIVILADDLGYGDVSANGSTTIKTPNFDRLANEGINFKNGYSTSATSTPSRYAMMTGNYPWRNKNARILEGDAPLLVSTDQFTLPKMMREAGYKTGAIGKWHLGMGNGNVNWNKKVVPGANEIGFDYSCLIAATNDRVPTVYVEDGYVENLDPNDPIEISYKKNFDNQPTGVSHPELLSMMWSNKQHANTIVNGIPRIGYMKGGKSACWVDEDMADYFMGKMDRFIKESKDKPFFLYFGLHQPHVPRAPHQRFVGASGMGPRGDAIIEADWCIGELLHILEREGILENTLIVFSSDNGPVLDDGYKDQAKELLGKHKPAGELRGGKYSRYDAGTHVPFFTYWKGTIKPKKSDAIVCQIDLMASLASLVDYDLQNAENSEDLLKAFLGKSNKGREDLVIEAHRTLAYRYGDWAMLPPYYNRRAKKAGKFELYNLKDDPGQTKNIAEENPKMLEKIKEKFLKQTEGFYTLPEGL